MKTHCLNFLIAGFLLLLFPLVVASFYGFPITDDFRYAGEAKDLGIKGAWLLEFYNMHCRYTATFLILLIVKFFPWIAGMPVIILFLILFSLASYDYFFSSFPNVSKQKTIFWTLASFVFYLGAIKQVGENFFYISASLTYQFSSAGILLFLGFLIRKSLFPIKLRVTNYAFVFLMAFLLSGFLSLYTVLLFCFSFLGWSLTILYQPSASRLWFISLIACGIGLAIMVLNPGVVKWFGNFPKWYVLQSLYLMRTFWFWILLTVLIYFWYKILKSNLPLCKVFKKIQFWLFVYVGFYTISCLLLFLLFIAGTTPRIISIFAFVVSAGWLPLVFYLQQKNTKRLNFKKEFLLYIAAFFLISIGSLNLGYKHLVVDLFSGKISAYHTEQQQRLKFMFKEVKAGKQHLIIPRLDNLPKSILATETELLTRDKGINE